MKFNKGQSEINVDGELASFHKKLSTGWSSSEYLEYRNSWEKDPSKKILKDYPLQIDIELSSICNLSCPMCYTQTIKYKNAVKTGYFDFELYKKIIDEVHDKIYGLRLSWRGESMLCPNFSNFIKYAKDKGIREISTLTNGSMLNLDFFKEITSAGIDWISVSIDGVGETYNKIRKPLIFEDTLKKIKDIKKYKEENNLIKPVIKIQTLWPAIKSNPEEYYNLFFPLVDLIAYNPLIDYLGNDRNIVYEKNFCCPQLYQRLYISSNGNAVVCNNDEYEENVVGNANTETIKQIWNGEKISQIRKIHNEKDGFKKIDMCKRCFVPRKTEKSEVATINGKKIFIENYINRKQIIGK